MASQRLDNLQKIVSDRVYLLQAYLVYFRRKKFRNLLMFIGNQLRLISLKCLFEKSYGILTFHQYGKYQWVFQIILRMQRSWEIYYGYLYLKMDYLGCQNNLQNVWTGRDFSGYIVEYFQILEY
ncbi:hypothetical protein IMG5_125100 [Ichthyophthirius multifiliis]|uniref:Uncharacterized protein n=1 Tax=Ichthyophthirius multifiliis TaxID=5932 RepID=G0QVP7_ICHMU|nr:hypothetical protein IMG5_125100 [Ichthyophthirius multifiliis]EGR30708.1 hypothetical protein IMG5_125100 [Ichthyophthirius multifiliis]|eukprot:XP_004032295.1 hypothetical protein IMG5_125100 [Ichthyophthirius multifiliis]